MRIQADPTFVPCPVGDGDELFPNGIFVFNVTRILETLSAYRLTAAQHVRFLTSTSAHLAFDGYWNGKVGEAGEDA
ncbi:MAG: hypothetical protein ACNA8N_04890 [Trueperaceae bacterium]